MGSFRSISLLCPVSLRWMTAELDRSLSFCRTHQQTGLGCTSFSSLRAYPVPSRHADSPPFQSQTTPARRVSSSRLRKWSPTTTVFSLPHPRSSKPTSQVSDPTQPEQSRPSLTESKLLSFVRSSRTSRSQQPLRSSLAQADSTLTLLFL